MERLFWRVIKLAWYSAMLFFFGLAMVLIDKDAYLTSYVSIGIAVLMIWISWIANTRWGRKCGK